LDTTENQQHRVKFAKTNSEQKGKRRDGKPPKRHRDRYISNVPRDTYNYDVEDMDDSDQAYE